MTARGCRIGYDARDVLRPRTGVVNHTRHLLQALVAGRGRREIVPYVDRHVSPDALAGVALRVVPGVPVIWKHVLLPVALAVDRIDLFHSPGGTLPLWAPCPMVVTIHDLFVEIERAWFPPRIAFQLRQTLRRACRVARRIIAVSAATKRDLVHYYGVAPARVDIVHNAVDAAFQPLDDLAAQQRLRDRYVGGAPFILYIGSRFPWRNVPRLVEAFARLRQSGAARRYKLLVVGRDIWGTDTSPSVAASLGLQNEVVFAGYVEPAEMPVLYRAAVALAYPSLYEGFGIPPLEAMASGTPVVTSVRGGLAEVVGDAALVVDPEDVASIATALQRVVEDDALRRELRGRGLEQAKRFTWERAAALTWATYEAALATG